MNRRSQYSLALQHDSDSKVCEDSGLRMIDERHQKDGPTTAMLCDVEKDRIRQHDPWVIDFETGKTFGDERV